MLRSPSARAAGALVAALSLGACDDPRLARDASSIDATTDAIASDAQPREDVVTDGRDAALTDSEPDGARDAGDASDARTADDASAEAGDAQSDGGAADASDAQSDGALSDSGATDASDASDDGG